MGHDKSTFRMTQLLSLFKEWALLVIRKPSIVSQNHASRYSHGSQQSDYAHKPSKELRSQTRHDRYTWSNSASALYLSAPFGLLPMGTGSDLAGVLNDGTREDT
ncbi:hypothetical protein Y032_0186g1069 [Ancylostoma ceylanicum]|nr:hypothetical protein Y032_0186g1069 [Ancylostoma ceylanicum]